MHALALQFAASLAHEAFQITHGPAEGVLRAARRTGPSIGPGAIRLATRYGKLHRHQEILDRYGAIANCPYKIDTASFVLETRLGIWTAQLLIKLKGASKKKRTFGEVTLQFVDGAQGRFAGLLPAADDDPGGGSPLH